MKTALLLLYLFFNVGFLFFSLCAQESDLLGEFADETAPSSGRTPDKNKIKNHLRLSGQHYLGLSLPLSQESWQDRSLAPYISNQLSLKYDDGTLFFSAGFDINYFVKESSIANFEFELSDFYLGFYLPVIALRLGWQKFSWGTAEGISPNEILNPRDYRYTVRRQRKLPVFGLQLQSQPVSFLRLEAVYLPFFRFAPGLIETDDLSSSSFPIAEGKPKFDFSEPTLAARIQFLLFGLDLSFSYTYGPDTAPRSKIFLNAVNSPVPYYKPDRAQLVPSFRHHVGAELRLALGDFNLWLDSSLDLQEGWDPESYLIRSPMFQGVLGFDFRKGQDLYLNLQYSVRWIQNQERKYQPSNPNVPFQLGQDEAYYRDYYGQQLRDRLAGINEELLQGIHFYIEYVFDLGGPELQSQLYLSYSLPLFYQRALRYGSFYIRPELSLKWEHGQLSYYLALGAEISFDLEEHNGMPEISYNLYGLSRYYLQNQLYLEFKLSW